MTTNITIKNNGPGQVTVRTHYLTDERKDTGRYAGHDLNVGEETTISLHRTVRVSADEIIPGVRTV